MTMSGKILRVMFAVLLGITAALSIEVARALGLLEQLNGDYVALLERGTTSLIIISVGVFASNMLTAIVLSDSSVGAYIPTRLVPIVSLVVRWAVWLLAINSLVSTWGGNTATFLGALGIVSVGIAFASQSTVANLFGFGMIVATAPFELGDEIAIPPDIRGRVLKISETGVSLDTGDGIAMIPNNVFSSTPIINYGADAENGNSGRPTSAIGFASDEGVGGA